MKMAYQSGLGKAIAIAGIGMQIYLVIDVVICIVGVGKILMTMQNNTIYIMLTGQ